jgi:DNA-directed RNA polymerase subunit RPC12/RpoP
MINKKGESKMEDKNTLVIYDEDGIEVYLEKTKYEVCPRCGGKGSHVNPNVDGHGISPEEFAEDPEFRENYFAGVYDVACCECNGKRVVKVIDWENPENKKYRKLYEQYLQDEADYWAEVEMERRMGC